MLSKKIYLLVSIVVLILSSIFYLKRIQGEQNVLYVLDRISLALDQEIKKQKTNALETAILIAKDISIIEALDNSDEDLGYKLLSGLTKEIQKYTARDIKVQILTDDYHIFARSWDDVYAGMPLEDYRSDLLYFKEHYSPRSSIETGRMLSIKTTVPVIKDSNIIGFVEIIGFFDEITEFFKKMGVDLYVLMDDRFYDIAVFMHSNELVGDYVLANRNYNSLNLALLAKADLAELKQSRITKVDGKYIFYENMKNQSGESIGAFVFVLSDKYLKFFKIQDEQSTFLGVFAKNELYEDLKQEEFAKSVDLLDIDSLRYLRDASPIYLREDYTNALRDKLESYTKSELVDLMLEQKIKKKVDAKIK